MEFLLSVGCRFEKDMNNKTKKVFLMHLSEVNNNSEVALKTVKDTLDEYKVNFNNIDCAQQDIISEVVSI